MTVAWPRVKVGELLVKSEDWITIDPDRTYREVTVRLWGKGIILRRQVQGADIAVTRRKRIKAGQLILSRIDARHGALGIVPEALDGAVVSNDFPAFTINASRVSVPFLGWLTKTEAFGELCRRASEGTTNRVRLQDDRFQSFEVCLPPIPDQERIVSWIGSLVGNVEAARNLKTSIEREAQALIASALQRVIDGAPEESMRAVAPIVRRSVEIDPAADYPELGIRSFGKGTFHKPALKGVSVGSKRLFRIEPGDLLFSNVFAWEGAVAVARPEDGGRFGSHRFMSCVPREGIAKAEFLKAFFLTRAGLDLLGAASPGGAGRNRTLGVEALQDIRVPLPEFKKQEWFARIQQRVECSLDSQHKSEDALDGFVASLLNKAFDGVLPSL